MVLPWVRTCLHIGSLSSKELLTSNSGDDRAGAVQFRGLRKRALHRGHLSRRCGGDAALAARRRSGLQLLRPHRERLPLGGRDAAEPRPGDRLEVERVPGL